MNTLGRLVTQKERKRKNLQGIAREYERYVKGHARFLTLIRFRNMMFPSGTPLLIRSLIA